MIGSACEVYSNQVSIHRGTGGRGGRAGVGGEGELGGRPGAAHPSDPPYQGALGGQGGCGGHGVGGNGGSSVGVIYLYDRPTTLLDNYLMLEGQPGPGGTSPTNSACDRISGQEGPVGRVMDYICCPRGLSGNPIAGCHDCPQP